MSLAGTNLATAPQFPVKREFSMLIKLSLSNNQIVQLPSYLFASVPALQHLDMTSNKLKFVDPQISMLTQLQVLRLDDNQLTSLPEEVF
jgi:Leucine-rich repeat (LRR) protein